MALKFIGRTDEVKKLDQLYKDRGGKLAVIYGRRRVGKTRLVEKFMAGKLFLRFEGLEHTRTKDQISHFVSDLSKQLNDPILERAKIDSWDVVFDYLTTVFSKSKYILFLDEFQWLAANQTRLVSILKKYWDQQWSKQGVFLILCGSVCSYMIKRVISSKALYGRINWELCLQPLHPTEVHELLDSKRSIDEIQQYSLILGGVPKYLLEINTSKSFDQNINDLFFTHDGALVKDYERIFYSQFKEPKIYENIVNYLKNDPKTLMEVSKHLKAISGGGIKSYLENLEKALFITSYVPYDKKDNSKLKKYKLTDEYLRFYFKFAVPNLKIISTNRKRDLFSQLVKPVWHSWLGFAFENFCLKNGLFLAELMGFDDQVKQWGPYFHRGDEGFQIDLVYLRQDKVVTICEIKYYNTPVPVTVMHEVEKKAKLIRLPRGFTLEKALISRFGPDSALRDLAYFHHYVQVEDFFK